MRIFLCSTFEDLAREREAVLAELKELRLSGASMESFGARPGSAIQECLDEVQKCTALVLLVAYRYGALVPGQQMSFTEAEYREGMRLGKPCLVYMPHDEVPVLPRHMETDPDKSKAVALFRRLVQNNHVVGRFKDAEDLRAQVRTGIDSLPPPQAKAEPAEPKDPNAWLQGMQEHGYSYDFPIAPRRDHIE